MLKGNYHTHTFRCGHAIGKDEEYVLEALGMGFLELGFSDHIMLPNFNEENIRGDISLSEDYFNSIRKLSKKYEDRMKIFLGYEAESFPLYFTYYRELLESRTIDYLILGNHSMMNENRKLVSHFSKCTSKADVYNYRDLALSALNSGLFSCFAHPDYFLSNIENIDKETKNLIEDMVSACVDLDIPLEINTAGIRNGKRKIGNTYRYVYPTEEFFQIAAKYNAKCIIGIDAHAPGQIIDEYSLEKAILFARRLNLNLVDKLDFKKF